MQRMQNNKPYYKHESPSDMIYQVAVQAAKESLKQTQAIAKEAKRKEREANKKYYDVYRYHLDNCLNEACLSPEEIMENITSTANSINHKTGLPYNSFLHRINYEKDLLEVVNGREIYKGAILSSVGFQIEVKKYYRKYNLSGVRFTFLQGKPILVMTIFLEPKEKPVESKEKQIVSKVKKFEPRGNQSKEIITNKPLNVNTYAILEHCVEPDIETSTVQEEIIEISNPTELKGAWMNKISWD
jgi:hypothetical protein